MTAAGSPARWATAGTGGPRSLLALESTCDETAAAIVREDGLVLGSAVATQERLHERFGGVVPEIAARAHLENFLPVLRATFQEAGLQGRDLAAIAVATRPGLPGSLLVGLAAAKGLALAWGLPLVSIDHLHAHVYACTLGRTAPVFPCVGLVVSGGHTHLYECRSAADWQPLGCTIDDAAGESFDKVAAMLGLPFPGGPALASLARSGNPAAFKFPRPLAADDATMDFSFSGLKTAVRYTLEGIAKTTGSAGAIPGTAGASAALPPGVAADVAASFERAVVDCVVAKCSLALRRTQLPRLAVGGGVAANETLRAALAELAAGAGVELIVADRPLCTDNAIMGAIAWEKVWAGSFDGLDLDAQPGLVRRGRR